MNRDTAQARGYNKQWQSLQGDHIKRYPTCVRCGQPGCMVDHIQPIKKAPHLRLEPTNFQTMCQRCHAIKTQRQDYGKSSGIMPDTNYLGYPTDPNHPWNND